MSRTVTAWATRRDALLPPPRVWTLHPGDVALAERGDRVETLLGTCVAVVLTDPRRTLAAMCHVVHAGGGDVAVDDGRWPRGDAALAEMARRLVACGIAPQLCEAFVVGGGNMFPTQVGHDPVGERNAAWALAALAQRGIRVVFRDLGGNAYRRVGWTVGPAAPEVAAVAVQE